MRRHRPIQERPLNVYDDFKEIAMVISKPRMENYNIKVVNVRTSFVTVNNSMGEEIEKLCRKDYNINRKETRRHCSYEVHQELFPNDSLSNTSLNLDLDSILNTQAKREILKKEIASLPYKQKELIYRVFYKEEKQCDIAKSFGISKMAITKQLKTIFKILRHKLVQYVAYNSISQWVEGL